MNLLKKGNIKLPLPSFKCTTTFQNSSSALGQNSNQYFLIGAIPDLYHLSLYLMMFQNTGPTGFIVFTFSGFKKDKALRHFTWLELKENLLNN